MAVISDIEIRLRADIARLQNDMNGARRSVDGAMGGITRAVNAAKGAFIGLAAGMSIGQLANFTDQYTKFTAQLKLATNSQQEYARAVEDVKRISTSAQTDIGATGVLYARIIQSTRDLGVAQNQVAKVTETVNLALAATGAGSGEAASAMLQLSQAFGSGVLRGEEFNAVYEAAPELLRILARDMDIPIGKLRKLAEAGALTSDKLVKAFSNDKVIEGLRENVAQITTISGAFTVFKNNLIEIIGTQAHASGAVKIITTAILGAADAVRILAGVLGPALKIGAAYIAAFVVAPALFQFTATAMGNLRLQIALAKLEMASGTPIATIFSTAIGGVGISAQWASGMLGKLTIATSLLFGAFVGWEIGKYIEKQFVEVEIAAEVMTGELLKAWALIKFAFKDAFDAITLTAREGIALLAKGMAGWYGIVAKGMRMIGDSTKADAVDEFAASMVKATEVSGTFAGRSAERRAEFEKEIEQIDRDTDRRSTNALMRDKLAEAADRQTAAVVKAIDKTVKATKEQIKAYADLIEALEDRVNATAREVAGLAPLTEAEKAHLNLTRMIAEKKVLLTAAQEARARSLINEAGANDVLIKSNKEWADLQQKLADNAKDLAEERYGLIESARQEAEQNELAIETYGMSEAAIIRLTASRLMDQEAQRLGRTLTADEIADLQRVIDLKERSAKAVANKAELEATKAFWADIEKTAHDTFVSIADGGKNAFQRLKDTAKNTFFDWLYQQTLKKWIISIGTSTDGVDLSSLAGGPSGSSGGISMDKIFSAFKSGGSLEKSIAESVQKGFDAAGLSPGGGTPGQAAQWAGKLGSTIGGYMAGSALNKGISGGYETGSGFMKAEKLATAVGSYINPVLGAAIGAISGVVNRAFGMRPKEYGNKSINGQFGENGFSGTLDTPWTQKGGFFRSDKKGVDSKPIEEALSSGLAQAYEAIKASSSLYADALGLDAKKIADRAQKVKIALGKDGLENEKAITDFLAGVADSVAKELLPTVGKFSKIGETASQTFERIAVGYKVVEDSLKSIGGSFGAVGVDSIAARERLIDLSGGLQEFSSNVSGFQQNFLTEAQRNAPVLERVTEKLKELGLASVSTRDQFRDAVLSLAKNGSLATAEGAKKYSELMALQADVAQSFPDAAAARGLEVELLRLQGRESEALASQREYELQSMDAGLRSLQQRVWALADEKAALEARSNLEIEIMGLLGDKSGALNLARAKEIEGMDAALRPLQQRIYALEDEALALETSNSLLEIQAQIYELNGDKAGAASVLTKQHAAALVLLDPALRGATQELWALEAAAKAIEKAKSNSTKLVEGVEAAFSVLKNISESQKTLLEADVKAREKSVQSLKKISDSARAAAESYRTPDDLMKDQSIAIAQITAAVAKARSGGGLPDEKYLEKAIKDLGSGIEENNYASFTDYQRDVALTRNALGELAYLSDDALTIEEKSLKAVESQIELIDMTLEKAQEQVDVLKGISVIGLSIEQAVRALDISLAMANKDPLTASKAAINNAYKEALGRAPDAAGLEWWSDKVAGGAAIGDVVKSITNSGEAQIAKMYRDILGREADSAGVAFWSKAFGSVVDSGEYAEFLKSAQPELDMIDRQKRQMESVATMPGSGTMSSSAESNSEEMKQMKSDMSRTAAAVEQLASQFNQVSGGGNSLLTEPA